jgi:pyruvate/2-oxoglutarate/acetoin dehydrogenase E1 component
MTLRDNLTEVCASLAALHKARFIGYNTAKGSRMYGTLAKVPVESCIEAPCAENLMMGMAIGMALEGTYLPVVCFERHEFVLFAMGMLAVMGDKMYRVGGGRFPLIIRAIRGGSEPLDPGAQHKVSYYDAIESACSSSVIIDQKDVSTDLVLEGLRVSPSGIVIIMEDRDGYEQSVRTGSSRATAG